MLFSESLKRRIDFSTVYQTGCSLANRYLVMYIRKNGLDQNRLGISVSKKVGNSVKRHRLMRLVRESYRLHEQEFNIGYDIVVVLRVHAASESYQKIESALLQLAKNHQILRQQSQNYSDIKTLI
ncbi:MAG: ribonuclease P protein component [Clostridium sp.]|jgi:ribonuclease P protein component|nr:ribonuclease P protein component [Clostridium sp.]